MFFLVELVLFEWSTMDESLSSTTDGAYNIWSLIEKFPSPFPLCYAPLGLYYGSSLFQKPRKSRRLYSMGQR